MTELVAADALTQYLHDHIPLTRHMGLVVMECSASRVVLSAPLEPNVNHRETAFGGSLSGMAILAGWTWIHARLIGRGPHRIVIHESASRFEHPVAGPFEAVCDSPPADEFERFLETLDRRGKARITLQSRVQYRNETAVHHSGRYVALYGA